LVTAFFGGINDMNVTLMQASEDECFTT